MNISEVYFIFAFLVNASLGLVIFFTNRRRPVNRQFTLLSVVTTLWLAATWLALQAEQPDEAKRYIQTASAIAIFIPASCLLLRRAIISPKTSWLSSFRDSRLLLLICMAVSAFCFSPFYIKSVIIPDANKGAAIAEPVYSWGLYVFTAYFVLQIAILIGRLPQDRKNIGGAKLVELEFITLGYISALSAGTVGLIYSILANSSRGMPITNATSLLVLATVIAYGITTRKILGIATILQRAAANIFLIAYLLVVYYAVWYGARAFLTAIDIPTQHVPHIIATAAVMLTLSPVHGRMKLVANWLIRTHTMDANAVLKQANLIFQSVTTFDALLNKFASLLTKTLDAHNVRILVRSGDGFRQVYSSDNDMPAILLGSVTPLSRLIETSKEPASRDLLPRVRQTTLRKNVLEQLQSLQCNLAVGIFSKSELNGIVLLGDRAGGRIYDRTEQDGLQLLCNQFAGALENAQLYTEVQDSKIRNEIMLDQLVSGVIVADPKGRITLFNHEAQRITGIDAAQAEGQSLAIFPQPIANALIRALETRSGERNIDANLFEQDEHRDSISVRMGSAYIRGYDEKPMGALLVVTDITELKSLEEQVRRSDQLSSVGTLAAGMAHEIKNPLVTIKTFSQLLPNRYADEDFRKDFSTLVAQEVERIDSIVNELLSFSKPAKPTLTPMRLTETLEQLIKLTHEQMAQKNITLNRKFQAGNDLILGDSKLLSQALINLALNAIEAIGKNGIITIGTVNCRYRFANGERSEPARPQNCLRLQISDSGVGIAREALQKIFDPFFTSKSEGTGMGLSVAHGIIREHHGAVEVESEIGRGTTFYVYIPVLVEAAA